MNDADADAVNDADDAHDDDDDMVIMEMMMMMTDLGSLVQSRTA